MKKKLRIIIDVEFEDEDNLDFDIRQKGKDTVDQQDLITIFDGIRNKLTGSETVNECEEDDDGRGDDEGDDEE